MSTMAKLTQAYRPDEESYVNIGRRHVPIVAGENIMMVVDLNSRGLVIDSPKIRGGDLEVFTRKFNLLTPEELRESLEISETELISVLNQCVQCVGCRRRVERLFYLLTLSGHPTLYPLVFSKSCKLTISEDKLKTPQALGTLLYRHHENLNTILERKLRTKNRCVLHSLDAFRSKPFSETWREMWSALNHNCRDELASIETYELHDVLEGYLEKHKFCTGCKAKIEKAYKILIGQNVTKEKGYVASLYANIKKCHSENHVHVATNKVEFLDALIRRAEPEVNGSYSKLRERHAKTLEIAQEEVLTCVGMIMYERLRRVYVSTREEEYACQVLAAISVHALSRSFDTFVERKQGISNLELLYQEMSKADKAKELRREQKKLKKKMKKNEKRSVLKLSCSSTVEADADESDVGSNQDHDNNYSSSSDSQRHEIAHDDEEDEAVDVGYDIHNNCASNTTNPENTESTLSNVGSCENVQCPSNNKTKSQQQNVNNSAKSSKNERKKKQKQKSKQKKNNSSNKNKHGSKANLTQTNIENILQSIDDVDNNTNCLDKGVGISSDKCSECLSPGNDCPCENDVRDSGYGSETNLSPINSPLSSTLNSPDGSEVSCSDGFCNHEVNDDLDDDQPDELLEQSSAYLNERSSPTFNCHENCCKFSYSLQELLDEYEYENMDDENSYIPEEVLLRHQCQYESIQKLRLQLREKLRQNFSRLCLQHCEISSSLSNVTHN